MPFDIDAILGSGTAVQAAPATQAPSGTFDIDAILSDGIAPTEQSKSEFPSLRAVAGKAVVQPVKPTSALQSVSGMKEAQAYGQSMGLDIPSLVKKQPEFGKAFTETLADKIKGLVPTSIKQAAEMATPIVPAIESIVDTSQKLGRIQQGESPKEVFGGDKTYDKFTHADWGKFVAGNLFDLAMAAGIAKGIAPREPAAALKPTPESADAAVGPKVSPPAKLQPVFDQYGLISHGETEMGHWFTDPVTKSTGTIDPKWSAKEFGAHIESQREKFMVEEPERTGIANRVFERLAEEGKMEPIQPGEGLATEDLIARGRMLKKNGADPMGTALRIAQTKAVSVDDMSVLRAHSEDLHKAAVAAERSGSKPAYDRAWKEQQDWDQNVVQPAKTVWSNTGKAMQGETDVDTGSFTGLRQLYVDSTRSEEFPLGKDVSVKQEPGLRKRAAAVKAAQDREAAALKKMGDVIKKKGTRLRTVEELRNHFAERLKAKLPC